MRNSDRTVIINTLCLAAAAGALTLAACTTDDPTATSDDAGGPIVDEGGTAIDGGPAPDGALPDTSVPPVKCTKSADCPSGVCNQATGVCAAASCKDGVKNANETDIDCGGDCAKCDSLKTCKLAADCISGVCADTGTGKKCQLPTNTDAVKNGNETGVDCGGTGNPLCADGQGCATRTDCTSNYCKANVCTPPKVDDGVLNGSETDVDCGGPDAKRCADGLICAIDTDCSSDVCKDLADGMGLRCQAPSYTDTKKNGAETDIDCGGDPAYPCATGKSCKVAGDCASLGCDYNFKCAPARSCTAHYGGDTCGLGGPGGDPAVAQAWESCCATAPVTTTPAGGVAQTVYLEKYPVTAGRMRVFLESIGYDVRTYVQQARAAAKIPVIPAAVNGTKDGVHPVLDASWDMYLPTSFAGNADAAEINDCDQGTWDYTYGVCCESSSKTVAAVCPAGMTPAVDQKSCHWYDNTTKVCPAGHDGKYAGTYTAIKSHLGGTIFRANSQTSTGCFVGSPGTHSFRFPDDQQDGSPPEQPVEVYDTKTLQCVDYLVAQAFCVWDGGRLETFLEWQAAIGGGATPWSAVDSRLPVTPGSASYFGCRFPWATDADQSQCAQKYDATQKTIEFADYSYSYEYPKQTSVDYIVHLTAPGRTRGRGPLGHSDLLGAGFEITSSVNWNTNLFSARHRWSGNGSWEGHPYDKAYGGSSMLLNKYGKLGLRCAKFAPAP